MVTSRSASSSTTIGDFPPNSSVKCFMLRAADAPISRPDLRGAGETDLVDALMTDERRACNFSITRHDVDDAIRMPASATSLANRSAVRGVCSAGLRTNVHPVANAGATFQMACPSGTFHGVMAPTTPMGLTKRHAEEVSSGCIGHGRLQCLSVNLGRPPSHVAQIAHGKVHVERAGRR